LGARRQLPGLLAHLLLEQLLVPAAFERPSVSTPTRGCHREGDVDQLTQIGAGRHDVGLRMMCGSG
jgi:hypothetical protein